MENGQIDTYLGDLWYSGSGDNGGVHYNSGVQNFWYYLIVEGGTGTNDIGYTYDVLSQGIKLSMDGKGRAIDNAFIERLWRSVKYEKLYLNPPKDGTNLYLLLAEYFNYYNMERRHTGIEDQIPHQLYYHSQKQAA
ncbi:integrase core domain-containing protein [Reichenbachiella faecimaris]|uniref:integrase core domain-containing protein n=1 Tax=Reichenbachiella faecimaris TaxID=692418 RepID=UPI0009FDAC9E|nr:integrase core domain-containing protein [Reichenbachiella faecimaris]